MKSVFRCLVGAFASTLVALSAWAGGAAGSGNILVAPQLAVAGNGPVTATFLGASATTNILGVNGSFGYDVVAIPQTPPPPVRFFPLFSSNPFAIQNPTTPALPAGMNITLATVFTAFPDGPSGMPLSTHVVSSTGGQNTVSAAFFEPPGSNVDFLIHLNAGVIDTGLDRVLIGFTPSSAMPSGFGGFDVRIALSNVCVR